MIKKLLGKIFGTQHDRDMKIIRPVVEKINSYESSYSQLTDDQLKAKTAEFKQRYVNGESTELLLPEAFAVCREASKRVLSMRHYDVQLIGGHVLHSGKISEMRTGEGKTLVATLPVYLNALTGKGVHVVTVNDYLAKRDAEWMGKLYNFLNLSVGIIVHDLTDRQRRQAYGSDITYGTNNEFGFDYLRDNMKFSLKDYVQRPFHYAIVDECDSILVDEARTPLIISGPAEASTDKYYSINKIIPKLQKEKHFVMEEKSKTASLTEEGSQFAEDLLGVGNLYEPHNIAILHHIYQALKAHHLYKVDVDYMIKDGEVVIVDEFTGRLMPGRRWSDGIHQAIEAKENVRVKNENQTLATVTFQNYFRMYEKLAGMTGTADTEAVEFKKIYNLEVIVIPTNKPISRQDYEDVVFKNEKGKFNSIINEIKKCNEKGQPVLVGTVSIEKSELLGEHLKKAGIKHNVLNAKHHEREAEIIAQAGRFEAITIATNMAGRGTDIVLGGNPEGLAKKEVKDLDSDEYKTTLEKYKNTCEEEKKKVIEAGGLYIIGTERHESRRIDNQLRGRSGRQGDPGASRFYLSLEDNLMRIFNGERIQKIMTTLKVPEDDPIEAPMVSRAIEGAQKKVEGHNFDIRKHLLEYDDIMNKHRTAIYNLRKDILNGNNVHEIVKEMLGDVTSHILDTHTPEDTKKENWDLKSLNVTLNQVFNFQIDFENELPLTKLTSETLIESIKSKVNVLVEDQHKKLGPFFESIERMLLLQTIDQKWKEHLAGIDQLKEGINLRAYAQKDPLMEYKKEAFNLFEQMDYLVKSETIEKLVRIKISEQSQPENINEVVEEEVSEMFAPTEPQQKLTFSHPETTGASGMPFTARPKAPTPIMKGPKVGRNDPCPCGSGKKFKKCHGVSAAEA